MSDAAPEPPLAYSPGDAARMLGCSRDTIYTLMRRGELQSYKVGGMRRIKRSDLLALLGG